MALLHVEIVVVNLQAERISLISAVLWLRRASRALIFSLYLNLP